MTIGFSSPDRTTLCVSDPVAELIEELQDLLREGPGLDAFRTGLPVVLLERQQSARWPLLLQGLEERFAPVTLIGLPIKPDVDVLGAITLYRFERLHDDFDLPGAEFLANAIGVAVVGQYDRGESANLDWMSRDRINQATGMVVVQLQIAPGDALALLRAHSFAHGTTLSAVADAVVRRELDFRGPDDRWRDR